MLSAMTCKGQKDTIFFLIFYLYCNRVDEEQDDPNTTVSLTTMAIQITKDRAKQCYFAYLITLLHSSFVLATHHIAIM